MQVIILGTKYYIFWTAQYPVRLLSQRKKVRSESITEKVDTSLKRKHLLFYYTTLAPLSQPDPLDGPTGAMCIQRFDDSRDAGRMTFRNSLRSSSTQEPSDPLLTVVLN